MTHTTPLPPVSADLVDETFLGAHPTGANHARRLLPWTAGYRR